MDGDSIPTPLDADETWDTDDLEVAYQRALEAVESAELAFEETLSQPDISSEEAASEEQQPVLEHDVPKNQQGSGTFENFLVEPDLKRPGLSRILEACLFVGGQPLSARRLVTAVEATGEPEIIEKLIDDMNQEYAQQNRPYEIRPVDGGYRMSLRPEFEAYRQRTYGAGPREVKLTQDVLEILALIAYQQPLSHEELKSCGKPNISGVLRQLLRRELVVLQRDSKDKSVIRYSTTDRFLQLFGLRDLSELPQADEMHLR